MYPTDLKKIKYSCDKEKLWWTKSSNITKNSLTQFMGHF